MERPGSSPARRTPRYSPAHRSLPIPQQSPAQYSPYMMATIPNGSAHSVRTHRPLKAFERVPTELWLVVFRILGRIWIPTQGSIGWILVTHVCRHWRIIALASPLLWTEAFLYHGRDWVRTITCRSRGVPLLVNIILEDEIKMSTNLHNLLCKLLRQHLGRIGTLSLRINSLSMVQVINILECSAPTLETLSLALNDVTSHVGRLPKLAPKGSQFPNLKRLIVIDCPVSWQSSAFSRLEILHLRVPEFTRDHRSSELPFDGSAPSLKHVLDALDKSSSTLRDLKLELGYIPPRILDRSREQLKLVHLSSLRRLSIDAEAYVLSRVLMHLRFPSVAILTLTSFTNNPQDDDSAPNACSSFDDILPAVRNAIQFSSAHGEAPDEIRISGFEDDFVFEAGWLKWHRLALRVVLEHKQTQAPVSYWLTWLYKLFCEDFKCPILRVQIDREMFQEDLSVWNDIFSCRSLQNLQEIGFSGPTSSTGLRYISGSSILPNITRMDIEAFPNVHHGHKPTDNELRYFFRSLQDAVSCRKTLQHIYFTKFPLNLQDYLRNKFVRSKIRFHFH